MITVATCLSLPNAYLIQSQLRGSGIEAFIPDECTALNYWSSVYAIGGVRVQIQAEDVAYAKELLYQEL